MQKFVKISLKLDDVDLGVVRAAQVERRGPRLAGRFQRRAVREGEAVGAEPELGKRLVPAEAARNCEHDVGPDVVEPEVEAPKRLVMGEP